MRNLFHTGVLVAACLLLTSGLRLQAQMGGGGGQMGGQGGRGGFGGGQMGQPVQGTVTAATSDKLTIKTATGDSYEITVTATARIMKAGQPIKLSDVKPGDNVTAMGAVDAAKKTVQAMMVNDIDAAMLAKAMENMGKTYIIGTVTAIDADNLKLTVLRSDKVSQAIALDDGTSFQRGTRGVMADVTAAGALGGGGMGGMMGGRGMGGGRQGGGAQAAPPVPVSITLADIKVGDSVMATGTLKNGAFTVLKMGVSEPLAAGGARSRPPQGQPAPAAGSGMPMSPITAPMPGAPPE